MFFFGFTYNIILRRLYMLKETYQYNRSDGIERSIEFNYRAVGVVSLWGLKVQDLLAIKRTSRLWNKRDKRRVQ